ncbi:MAG: zf-HC2 domain-containing protein [Myxococcales bacterium]|nr:zf-HC2 domain-containing protein [Myxococcales bacterium]
MSLEDIRSECSDIAGLLQPYVDGELNEPEQEQVAHHLESCKGCRSAVSEQAWVRATLQGLERETAPQALRAKILLGLDEVDRERAAEAAASAPPSLGSRVWSRLRELGRGGLIMVPAGAVAAAVFVMAQQGVVTPTTPDSTEAAQQPGYGLGSAILPGAEANLGGDHDVMRALAELEPQVGFQVQVAQPGETTAGLQLVGASLDRADRHGPAARLRYQLPGGEHVVDRQLPAHDFSPSGTSVEYFGRSYHLHHDDTGRPLLSFLRGGVAHVVVLEGGMVRAPGPVVVDPKQPDYALLLKFAARLGGP